MANTRRRRGAVIIVGLVVALDCTGEHLGGRFNGGKFESIWIRVGRLMFMHEGLKSERVGETIVEFGLRNRVSKRRWSVQKSSGVGVTSASSKIFRRKRESWVKMLSNCKENVEMFMLGAGKA